MPESDNLKNNKKADEFISIIYNQKNDSPKYFELKKSKILLFIIGLPTVTLISLVLGAIGLVHTSPFHLIDTYRQNSKAREAIAKSSSLITQIQTSEEEKAALTKKLAQAQEQLQMATGTTATDNTTTSGSATSLDKCPASPVCPVGGTVSSIGLSTLSIFGAVQGQRDRTKPATLNLSEFKVIGNRDTINLQFNIIPVIGGEAKLAGHIIVLMKNELTIQVYPGHAFNSPDIQINYSSGEPFSTQRFRPVDAGFLKPRKPGNYTFAVYIFAKNGDLLHSQNVIMPVKF